jgi:ACS family allantoate permease-like MFS transporter
MAIANANCAGCTKKTTMDAIIFIGYCAAQVAGPQVFQAKEAPVYRSAFLSSFICFALMIVFLWGFQAYLMWENKRRDRLVALEGLDPNDHDFYEGFHDLTD